MQRLRASAPRLFVVALAACALLLVIPIWMRSSVSPYLYTSAYSAPSAEVVIVPGAAVIHGVPSPVLAARADVAIALYKLGRVRKVLVTGDDAALSHDEVTPVRKYLLDAGVAPQDIFLDHAGFDTYSSMYRARSVFGVRSAIVATQDFHMPRALWIARSLGISAYGVVASGAEGSLFDYLREIPASLKALWDTATRRVPAVSGPQTPLSGDGRDTWY